MRYYFEAQTLDALAIKIDSADLSHWKHLVSIKPVDKPSARVFCIHPVGGEVLCYRDFARSLPDSVEVFAIQAQGLLQGQQALSSASSMMEMYQKLIEPFCTGDKEVPCYLAGQSIGGVFALALAQLLNKRAENIRGVALFDSFLPNEANLEMIGIGHLQSALGAFMQLEKQALEALPEVDQLQVIFEKAKAAYLIPQEIEFREVSSRYLVAQANIQAASELQLQKNVDIKVLHVEAETSLSGKHSSDDWKKFLKQGEYRSATGHHESIMLGASAQVIAEHFSTIFNLLEH